MDDCSSVRSVPSSVKWYFHSRLPDAPKYTELYQASKLSELEYTFISNICEKTIKEEAIQYYKPALVNGMADFIRTFLPDAMPIIKNQEFEMLATKNGRLIRYNFFHKSCLIADCEKNFESHF